MMISLQRSLHLLLYLALLCQLIKCDTAASAASDSGEYYYDDAVDENDVIANDDGDDQVDRKSTEVAEERFFVNSVFKFLSDPSSEAFFIIRMFFQVRLFSLKFIII